MYFSNFGTCQEMLKIIQVDFRKYYIANYYYYTHYTFLVKLIHTSLDHKKASANHIALDLILPASLYQTGTS